ncbi:CDP-diacylglycerol--glycerol-3-phosphate 3-phosphatidyltransferase, partial [bacterium]|nr:CDP-diacylglycerol--glycerol-3-phosphate 3-phosphatidyltransferase [bacterium]
MKINVPNVLTIFRILLTPLFIICLFYDYPYARLWALVIFIVASITDAFDGHYARKLNQVTRHGKFLDPLADKILVSSAFISFAIMDLVPFWMVGLIIFRDLFVTGLRMVMESQGLTMITSKIAKAKTTTQISVIIFIL